MIAPAPRIVAGKCSKCGATHAVQFSRAEKRWVAEACKAAGYFTTAPAEERPVPDTEVAMAAAMTDAGLNGWAAKGALAGLKYGLELAATMKANYDSEGDDVEAEEWGDTEDVFKCEIARLEPALAALEAK